MNTLFLSHLGLAYLSLILLLLRGVLSAKKVDWRRYKIMKIAPHMIDSLLLVSGIGIFVIFGFSWTESWIWSKLLFLVLYVIFATKTFKHPQGFSLKYFLLAVVSFMLVMLVAVMH